ncbi:hypothetical protein AK51_31945 [Serratia nematodiphila DZ0503SBS1]|nr:hypothetical protein AK51_31945 [Serratia nematodiphila DZ0503SBS1]
MPPVHPITIRDVAKRAGVSVATVSRVLNHSALTSKETREQVLQAVADLAIAPMPTRRRWRPKAAIRWAWW